MKNMLKPVSPLLFIMLVVCYSCNQPKTTRSCPVIAAPVISGYPVIPGETIDLEVASILNYKAVWLGPDGTIFEGFEWERPNTINSYLGVYKVQYISLRNRRCKSPFAEYTIKLDTEVRLTSATFSVTTPSSSDDDDGKDWDTRAYIGFNDKNGHEIGYGSLPDICCVNPGTRIPADGSTRGPFNLKLGQVWQKPPMHKTDLQNGSFDITLYPSCPFNTNCHDTWYLIPSITLKYSDGTSETFSNYTKTKANEDIRPRFPLQ